MVSCSEGFHAVNFLLVATDRYLTHFGPFEDKYTGLHSVQECETYCFAHWCIN